MMEDNFLHEFEEKENAINFFSEDINFKISYPEKIEAWIQTIIKDENHILNQINYIFCSDSYLLKINQEYLNHDTLTDIITFPYASSPFVQSDIFISIERVKENADLFKTTFDQELLRVIIHGVLHLCGYADKDKESQSLMHAKENEALVLFDSLA